MKQEFSQIIQELKECAKTRAELPLMNVDQNRFYEEKLRNISIRINGLESSALDIFENYSENPDMLINFKKRANEIREEIENLDSAL